jgi:hypothetical protein
MSKNTQNAKKQTSQKGKKQSEGFKPVKKTEKSTSNTKLPVWYLFTRKSVAFANAAAELSESLQKIYGRDCTISQFEKLVALFPSLTKEEKGLIYLDKATVELLDAYNDAKEAKDNERKSFRTDIVIKDVSAGIKACLSSFDSSSETGQENQIQTPD